MGSSASVVGAALPTPQQPRVPKWRRVLSSDEARRKYELDGSLPQDSPSGLLELRGFLDDPMLMKHVGMFGKTRKSFDCFMCWVDVQEFKSIGHGSEDYRRSKALHVYQKYLKEGALLRMGNTEAEFAKSVEGLLDTAKKNKIDLSPNIFDKLQQHCLQAVYTDIFLPFKYSTIYNKVMKSMQHHYNRITPDDFEYIEVLGQGGFGLVVHCKKKSTGKHYALKMQTKMGLLKCYKNVLHRVDFEKQALAACNHPFIVTLDYAFQTNTLVFLAMQLGTGGTLHDALSLCPHKCMPEERVKYYTAEIVLALAHIHGLGMIYRDLKPPNILLNADGHIQLVDLGGIIDPGGRVLGLHDESEYMLNGLFVKDFAHFTEEYHQGQQLTNKKSTKASKRNPYGVDDVGDPEDEQEAVNLIAPVKEEDSSLNKPQPSISRRAKSIMGTDGYMAIEMMMLRLQKHEDRKGYTNAVDWWSLGVTMFVLLTGLKPFPLLNSASVAILANALKTDPAYMMGTKRLLESVAEPKELPMEYLYIHEKLNSPYVQADASTINIILLMLDFNEKTRLGSKAAGGLETLKQHEFFMWSFNGIEQNGAIEMFVAPHVVQERNLQPSDPNFQYADIDIFDQPVEPVKPEVESVVQEPVGPPEYCWDYMEQKQILPPFMPETKELNDRTAYGAFDEMMTGIDKVSWLKQYPSTYYDEYFQNWYGT